MGSCEHHADKTLVKIIKCCCSGDRHPVSTMLTRPYSHAASTSSYQWRRPRNHLIHQTWAEALRAEGSGLPGELPSSTASRTPDFGGVEKRI